MPNWGPVTVSNGPGSITVDNRRVLIQTFGPFLPGEVNRVSGTSHVTFTGGRSDAVYDVRWQAFASNGDEIEGVNLAQFRLTTPDASWNRNVPTGATRVDLTFGSALYAGQTQTCTASGTFDAGTFCQFGTRPKSTIQATIVLTADNLADALAAAGYPWLGIAFQSLVGISLDMVGLCGVGPPQIPQINTSLLEAPNDEKLQVLKRILWDQSCECIPGAPTPAPYPPVVITQPTSWPATPTFPCDPADLCTSISKIRADLNALLGSMSATRTLVELLQRYRLPFAYVRGAVHSNLVGKSSFAVSRLIGLDLDVTTIPPDAKRLRGNPEYIWDLGWLSVSDANGMLHEQRLSRDTLLWLPEQMPQATVFAWDLFDGVVMRATELQAET